MLLQVAATVAGLFCKWAALVLTAMNVMIMQQNGCHFPFCTTQSEPKLRTYCAVNFAATIESRVVVKMGVTSKQILIEMNKDKVAHLVNAEGDMLRDADILVGSGIYTLTYMPQNGEFLILLVVS